MASELEHLNASKIWLQVARVSDISSDDNKPIQIPKAKARETIETMVALEKKGSISFLK
jgi:hypothetical protein